MKTLNASELMSALKERKAHEPSEADFTYAEPEPRLEPAMPAGGQMTDFEKRWCNLTVGEAIELNKKALEFVGAKLEIK